MRINSLVGFGDYSDHWFSDRESCENIIPHVMIPHIEKVGHTISSFGMQCCKLWHCSEERINYDTQCGILIKQQTNQHFAYLALAGEVPGVARALRRVFRNSSQLYKMLSISE